MSHSETQVGFPVTKQAAHKISEEKQAKNSARTRISEASGLANLVILLLAVFKETGKKEKKEGRDKYHQRTQGCQQQQQQILKRNKTPKVLRPDL